MHDDVFVPLVLDEVRLREAELLELGCLLFNHYHEWVLLAPPRANVVLPLRIEAPPLGGLRLAQVTLARPDQRMCLLEVTLGGECTVEVAATEMVEGPLLGPRRGVVRAMLRARNEVQMMRLVGLFEEALREVTVELPRISSAEGAISSCASA